MARPKTTHRVVGIDVGGSRKGFHAVALEDGVFLARRQTSCAKQLAGWCREEIGARLVAVDAPCRWSTVDGARPAERELLQRGIRCFLTPTRRAAVEHPKDYYEWMLRGADIFRCLEPTHPLCRGTPTGDAACSFETFPHAITWHLQGGHAEAAKKRVQRLALLRRHGGFDASLVNLDWIDAAHCAAVAAMAAAARPLQI